MIWLRKIAAISLLSVGAALVFLPWPVQLESERTREVVRLEIHPAPFTAEAAEAEFGDSFIALSYEGMAEVPEVREAVLGLMGQSRPRCVPLGEWQTFLAEHSVTDPEGLAYAFHDGLHRISGVEARDLGPDGTLVCFEATILGAYDNPDWNPMSRVEAGDLDGHPELKAELERLAAGPVPAETLRAVSPRQWRRFHRRELDGLDYQPSFVVHDKMYSGAVVDELVPWTLETPWLRQTAGAIGAAAMLLGIVLAVAAYRAAAARPGIPISSPWLAVFCDVISLVGGSIFTVLAIDTLWVGPLGQPSLVGLSPEWPSTQPITGLHFVSLPVILVALPLLTLWFTSLSAQRIQVDPEGVTSHGALGSISIPWQDLEHIHLREQKNPFSFTVVDFRSLQKVLKLEGAEVSVTINEPGSRARKQQIWAALREHLPEAKRNLLDAQAEEW